MNIRKTITTGVPLALVTILTVGSTTAATAAYDASITPRHDSVSELRSRTIVGTSFDADLAREYKTFADYEWEQMYDWADARKHAAKGNLAATGKTPMPSDPAKWNIKSQADLNELQIARKGLITALDDGGRSSQPLLAAKAQATYDCWVEQQEEGHQPAHIAACKVQFAQAMANLDAAMKPKLAAAPVPKTVTTVSSEIAREVVFFDFDKSTVSARELAKIDRFVTRMRAIDNTELTIVGHTDTAGSGAYNQTLSAARARGVTDKLIADGMRVRELSDLNIYARGERQPTISTGNGVREARNRRVEIVAFGTSSVSKQVSALSTR